MPPFDLQCRRCGYTEVYTEPRPCCPACGAGWLNAIYNYEHARQQWATELPYRPATLWRYHELLPLRDPASRISFGEGWTPLIRAENLGLMLGHPHLYIKDERQGPTASFKDRQAAIAVSSMKAAGIHEAVVSSTGNVAIAYSAYCARAGIKLWVFVTSSVPADKMREVALYGSEVIKVAGTYDQAKQIAAEFAASRNIFLDRGIKAIAAKEAMKTVAYEIAEQMGAIAAGVDPLSTAHANAHPWQTPDWFVQAISGGMGPVGVMQGFADLRQMGRVDKMPKLALFQVAGCAPMAQAFGQGLPTAVSTSVAHPATDIATLATGVPGEAYEVLFELIQQHGGLIESVTDTEAFRALKVVAQMDGISVEPATAVAFAGLFNLIRRGVIQPHETVVINASGHTFPVEKHIVGERYTRDMHPEQFENDLEDPREDGLLRALEALDERVKRIAIIEDNPDATRLVRRILQSQGNYFIDEATNGADGLALIRETRPNLVILDLMMPGVDGFTVVDTMKNDPHLRRIPIIVITAKELTPIEKRRLSGKIKGLLQKGSFMDVDLLRDIQEVLP